MTILVANFKKLKGFKQVHNLGIWQILFVKYRPRFQKKLCSAITIFGDNLIKIYRYQDRKEIKNSLRHEFFHILEDYRERREIIEEEYVCLAERLTEMADLIADKWFREREK